MKHEPMTTEELMHMTEVVKLVMRERQRQHELWGEQDLELGWQFGSDEAIRDLQKIERAHV